MTDNPYSAPQAELADPNGNTAAAPFYVVAPRKFTTLFLATMGLYSIYWFYKNWRCYKDSSDENIWPVARAIFSIFFVHALFRRVDEHAQSKSGAGEQKLGKQATSLVVLMLVSQVLDRASMKEIGSPVTDILSLLILIPLYFSFSVAQKHINQTCEDPLGQSNAELSPANIAWIIGGALLWVLAMVGLFL